MFTMKCNIRRWFIMFWYKSKCPSIIKPECLPVFIFFIFYHNSSVSITISEENVLSPQLYSQRVNVCFLPWQESDKCFECNSQHRYDHYHRNSHRIENVIYLMDRNGNHTWWQSVNGLWALRVVYLLHNSTKVDALSWLPLSSYMYESIFVQGLCLFLLRCFWW